MNFNNTEVWGFEHALRGMRNPKNSWDKSDSKWRWKCLAFGDGNDWCDPKCHYDQCLHSDSEFYIGENDMKLAMNLIRAGSEHRKFLRQIFVSVDITAPLYWWKEFDTYKVGTVANSTSTMHKLASTPITVSCFEIDDYKKDLRLMNEYPISDTYLQNSIEELIRFLERLRLKYLETSDKRYWKELIRWLPEGWLQTRTVTMTYENLLSIAKQRRNHKLNEWSGKDDPTKKNMIAWMRTLPYAQQFIFYDEVTE